MAIPKIIHYVWCGTKEMPEKDRKYLEGWKKLNPDYKIKCWSDKDIDLDKYPLAKQAVKEKRWSLVSDVLRAYAVYTEGGFYLDTDVELLKSLDELTKYDAVIGWESNYWFSTAVFGAKKHSPWIKKVLERYEHAQPKKKLNTNDFLKAVHAVAVYARDIWPIEQDGETRTYGEKNELAVFSREYFSPKHYMTGKDERTKNTIAYHHYASTWHTRTEAIKNKITLTSYNILGPKLFSKLERQFARNLEKKIRKELS